VDGARTGVDISRSEFASYTVNDNTTASSAIGNSATNGLAVGAGNLARTGSGTVAFLGNLQQMDADSIALTENAGIGSFQEGTRDSTHGVNNYAISLTSSVSGNTLGAVAKGNVAAGASANTYGNVLTASGTNLVDAGTAPSAASYGADGQATAAAFILQSNQSSTAGTRSATVANGFIGNLTSAYLSGNVMTVDGNVLTAEASDNFASSRLGLDFGNLTTTAMLQNAQESMATMASTVSNAGIGIDAATDMGKDNVTVAHNVVNASVAANTAANLLDLTAANSLGGNAADASSLGIPSGYRGAASSEASGAMVLADYGVTSVQDRSGGDISASVQTAELGVSAGGKFDERDLSPYTTSNNDAVATINDNAVSASAQGNSADSRLVLDASSVDTTAAIYSRQSMASNASASAADIDIGLRSVGSMSLRGATAAPVKGAAMPMTVADNSVNSSARLNDAVNVLSVAADSTIAGSGGDVGASNDASRFDGFAGAVADFAVASEQSSSSDASASLNDVTAGVFAGGDIGSLAGRSSLTVSDNSFAAQASGNTATNSVLLDAAGSVSASAAVSNAQALTGGAIHSDVTDVTVAAGNLVGFSGAITTADVVITGNNVSGSASGNSATNAISVQGTALNGLGLDTEGAINGLTGSSTAIANHALNNVQRNDAAVSSTMASINIGSNVSGGIGALVNSTATVGNNSVVGSASGNSASNSIMLASVAGIGMPSASLVSSQVNAAAISATVNNATIGVNAGVGSNSSVTVSGNTIIATATGNSVINHIGIGN
jgi:acetyltransferase-like isoleucine patch superfamily enzyme